MLRGETTVFGGLIVVDGPDLSQANLEKLPDEPRQKTVSPVAFRKIETAPRIARRGGQTGRSKPQGACGVREFGVSVEGNQTLGPRRVERNYAWRTRSPQNTIGTEACQAALDADSGDVGHERYTRESTDLAVPPAATIPQPSSGLVPLTWASRRRRWVLPVVVCAGLVLLGLGLREVLSDTTQADDTLVYYTVRKGNLPIVVTERGNLESQQTEKMTCEVESVGGERMGQVGTQILFIVPNGSSVKKNDLLVELDAAPLKERLDLQFLTLQRAEAEMIQANSKFDNQITQNETNLAEAELKVALCKLDLESYVDVEDESGGTFQIELQNIDFGDPQCACRAIDPQDRSHRRSRHCTTWGTRARGSWLPRVSSC